MTYFSVRKQRRDKEKRYNGCSRPGNGLRRIVYLVIKHNGKERVEKKKKKKGHNINCATVIDICPPEVFFFFNPVFPFFFLIA